MLLGDNEILEVIFFVLVCNHGNKTIIKIGKKNLYLTQ